MRRSEMARIMGTMTSHTITCRLLAGEADFWRMRDLLVASVANTPLGLNWDIRRLEGKRFYNADPAADDLVTRPVALWEDAGELVGFVMAESACDAYLQVHVDHWISVLSCVDTPMGCKEGPGLGGAARHDLARHCAQDRGRTSVPTTCRSTWLRNQAPGIRRVLLVVRHWLRGHVVEGAL